MARRDKMYMPMGAGGLIRYSEEEKELIKIKPKQVVYIVIGIIALEIILKVFFG
ncbi:MAG: preprotein translocase subunit Sec61beta [Candidatus Aenigmarchaeota archaeon]|nr:preprotein translocase subunit Sec61beta [Candidatus Aenigmarchaeota archaeon]